MESVNDKGSYVCTNDGCEHNFEHNTSLSRHMRTCTSCSRKTNKVDLASFALLENGKYECLKCKQTFKHKNALYNTSRKLAAKQTNQNLGRKSSSVRYAVKSLTASTI